MLAIEKLCFYIEIEPSKLVILNDTITSVPCPGDTAYFPFDTCFTPIPITSYDLHSDTAIEIGFKIPL